MGMESWRFDFTISRMRHCSFTGMALNPARLPPSHLLSFQEIIWPSIFDPRSMQTDRLFVIVISSTIILPVNNQQMISCWNLPLDSRSQQSRVGRAGSQHPDHRLFDGPIFTGSVTKTTSRPAKPIQTSPFKEGASQGLGNTTSKGIMEMSSAESESKPIPPMVLLLLLPIPRIPSFLSLSLTLSLPTPPSPALWAGSRLRQQRIGTSATSHRQRLPCKPITSRQSNQRSAKS